MNSGDSIDVLHLKTTIRLLKNSLGDKREEIKSLEEEILSCPAVSYHTQKPEDIGACVHPYNKVYEDDTNGQVVCYACNEVLIDILSDPREVTEWHKEGPNPPLLEEEEDSDEA